jgi:osmotically-inducible protein OsmY
MKASLLWRILFAAVMLNLAVAVSQSGAFPVQRQVVVNDDSITDQVRIKLSGDPVVKGGAIQVDCKQGVVTLSGAVKNSKQKTRAGQVAKTVKGVKQVINNLMIISH